MDIAVECLRASWVLWIVGIIIGLSSLFSRLIGAEWIRALRIFSPLSVAILYWVLICYRYDGVRNDLSVFEVSVLSIGYFVFGVATAFVAISDIVGVEEKGT